MFNRGRGKCGIKEFSCVSVAVILINLHTQRDEFGSHKKNGQTYADPE